MKNPEKGFYYHYKHDPKIGFNNYAYEVLGIAQDTEDQSRSVVYRPLYQTDHLASDYYNRPIDMFAGEVRVGNKTLPRFTKITDPSLIGKLEKLRDEMYPKKKNS